MNQINILNILHKAFLKLKNASHFMFVFMIVIIFASGSSHASGENLVPLVETKISVIVDEKNIDFTATQNTLEGALVQGDIKLNEFDITEPPRGSLLKGGEMDVQVIRALPVLISDNGREVLAFSGYTEPAEILKQLKYVIYPEDKITAELIMDPVDDNAVGQKVIIERAPVHLVSVDGEEKTIRSWGKTVSEVLKDKVPLGAKDIVKPSVSTGVFGSIRIVITRVNEAEVEVTETIEYQTIYKNDYSLYEGETKVVQAGNNGQKKMKYKIVYHNGVEIDRAVLDSEVLSTSVNKIVIRGLRPYDAGYWWDTLVAASNRYPNNTNISPDKMYRVMMCESGGNQFSGTYYKGLFQYSPSTWAGASAAAGYGGAKITDGKAQIYVTAWKVNHDGGWYAWGCKP